MTVKLIIAVDRDNAIGWKDGRLPWKLRADMQRFKEMTTGSTVLMGWNTYASLNRPAGLPNRHNVVLTRRLAATTSEELIEGKEPRFFRDSTRAGKDCSLNTYVYAHQACLGCLPPDLWIIGGAQVYTQAIEQQLVDEIYLTTVDMSSGADVTLPFNLYDWRAFISQQEAVGVKWYLVDIGEAQHADDGTAFTFVTLKKYA